MFSKIHYIIKIIFVFFNNIVEQIIIHTFTNNFLGYFIKHPIYITEI